MRARIVLLALALSGCSVWPLGAGARFTHAEDLLAERRYTDAIAVYDEILAQEGPPWTVRRARAGRETAAAVVAAQAEIARLQRALEARGAELAAREGQLAAREGELAELRTTLTTRATEVTRLTQELASREAELGRARHDLDARQAEMARLAGEAERMRADLEDLKRLEMRLERRRP